MDIEQAAERYDNKDVIEFGTRMVEHLKANKVDVERTKGSFGPSLVIDPKTETFKGGGNTVVQEKANAMLFREYRKGFELKEIA